MVFLTHNGSSGTLVTPTFGSRARLKLVLNIEMTSIGTSHIEKETELKKEKSKLKSSFTLYRNRLLVLIEEQGLPRSEMNSACRKIDMESSMEAMSQLANIYIRNNQFDKGAKIVNEVENNRRIPLCVWDSLWIYEFNQVWNQWILYKERAVWKIHVGIDSKERKVERANR